MPAYSVLEYKSLPHGEGPGCIPAHLASRLAAVAQKSSFAGRGESGVLEDQRHALRARGVVGVIAADDCSLEVLPKIDVPAADGSAEERGEIRKRLVHMLAVALDLKIETGRLTDLDWQHETLLEILIRIFCDKLTEAVRRGMPRRYIAHEEDLSTLRGTLDLPRQFTHHAANPSRLACRFDELSEDIALNRIMKVTIAHLSRMSRRVANLQWLRELAFVYADIATVPVPALRWDEVVIDRTNRAWQALFGMAQLFLHKRYQTTSAGSGHGTALLFEMKTLFEEYVGRLVARSLEGTEFYVRLQGGREYCLTAINDGRRVFQTKPDILIRRDGQVVHVIDTKWKRISSRIDDPKQGVSQADVYQMMAYAHHYKAPKLTLLYPHYRGLGGTEGVQSRFRITGQETFLEIATVDVALMEDIVLRLREIIHGNGSVRRSWLEPGRGPTTLRGMTQRSPFRYFKTSPEVIRLAVMLYIRFPLSLRNVEDLLHERGIEVSHETVRFWWQRFGPMFATEIRRKRVSGMRSSRWRWHLDEVFVKINGVQHYLWRAVDHEGEVLEAFVSKRRDKKAALKFLRKLMKRHGQPEELVTDGLRSYGAALKALGAENRQVTGRWENYRIENSHQPSEGERGQCCGSGACEVFRSSSLSTPQFATTSTRIGASPAALCTSRPAPPLLPSGGRSVPVKIEPACRKRDEFAFV